MSPPPPLLGPIFALASWTFVMQAWLYACRIPDITTYKIQASPSTTKTEFEKALPPHRRWPSDNFANLHEQPTVFYAVALALTFAEVNDRATVAMAWGYIGARVVHSLVQVNGNIVMRRFGAFIVSSGLLAGMTVKGMVRCFL